MTFIHSASAPPRPHAAMAASQAPGFVMGIVSIGKSLLRCEESDTFSSADSSVTWHKLNVRHCKRASGHKQSRHHLCSLQRRLDDMFHYFSIPSLKNGASYDGLRHNSLPIFSTHT
ncbi:hypothetical protein K443DRAFT_107033 [Laccaria amethystina LaAM-08-1]|uniref:Uncharacterized protein n=1 Tax=Laccaria amethystina LaAM-08-1 TaxID=1095629 RepID=A0A0C9WVP0_9AGAR|nr:hypothetical protein K443DRAFT_107033 [Laccaria amethystina LaAM-08-1]